MNALLLAIITGIIVGVIDILPMIKMQLNKYSITSAFLFYFCMPFIIFSTDFFGIVWWLKGGLITFILASPIMILVLKEDRKAVPVMALTSVILGSLIGAIDYFAVQP